MCGNPPATQQQLEPLNDNSHLLIPSRAIKVPANRTQIVKKNEDFRNMKNLFLANCLKMKEGEYSLS